VEEVAILTMVFIAASVGKNTVMIGVNISNITSDDGSKIPSIRLLGETMITRSPEVLIDHSARCRNN